MKPTFRVSDHDSGIIPQDIVNVALALTSLDAITAMLRCVVPQDRYLIHQGMSHLAVCYRDRVAEPVLRIVKEEQQKKGTEL